MDDGCGAHDGSFRECRFGWVLAVIQATRTLSGWSTRWSRASPSTRSVSPATQATAMATTWRSRVVCATPAARWSRSPGTGANSAAAHDGGHVDAGLGPLDDLGDGGVAAHHQLMDHVVGFGGHVSSVDETPDTALTRRPWAYPEVVIVVSVLDVVELHRDGQRIAVRPGKTTEVLIRLALEAGVMVRTERLIDDLWADEAAGTARNVLQTKVSRLRRALGDAALVTGTKTGYTLEVDPSAVDALEVLRLAGQASAFRHAGDPSAALEACTTALAMFRGRSSPPRVMATGSSRTVPASGRSVSVSSRTSSRRGSTSAPRAR
jgi:DNA-binding winged helix-turn-helix (wHTH) protein